MNLYKCSTNHGRLIVCSNRTTTLLKVFPSAKLLINQVRQHTSTRRTIYNWIKRNGARLANSTTTNAGGIVRGATTTRLSSSVLFTQRPGMFLNKTNVNYFSQSFVDRSSDKRKNNKWIEDEMKRDTTVYVLYHVDKPFVNVNSENKNMYSLCRFNYDQVKHLLAEGKCKWIFLGVEYEKTKQYLEQEAEFEVDKDKANAGNSMCRSPYSHPSMYDRNTYRSWFAIDASGYDANTENITKIMGKSENGTFFEGNFLRLMAIQDPFESSIIAQARSVFCWIDRNKFCATCGSPNELSESGYKLACNNDECKSHSKTENKHVPSNIHYPRVDPVVIMLIVNPARTHLLLGRKKMFPKNMYSCLAGYVEAGESIEEAVRRESYEESGVYTDRVVYHSSQPWPFPSTLMIGCLAYATSTDIQIDMDEIEHARWFSLDEIDLICKQQHPDNIMIPSERTIANQLINYWNRNKSKL